MSSLGGDVPNQAEHMYGMQSDVFGSWCADTRRWKKP